MSVTSQCPKLTCKENIKLKHFYLPVKKYLFNYQQRDNELIANELLSNSPHFEIKMLHILKGCLCILLWPVQSFGCINIYTYLLTTTLMQSL